MYLGLLNRNVSNVFKLCLKAAAGKTCLLAARRGMISGDINRYGG